MDDSEAIRGALRACVARWLADLTLVCAELEKTREQVAGLEGEVAQQHQRLLLAAELLAQLTDGKEGQDIIDGWQEVP